MEDFIKVLNELVVKEPSLLNDNEKAFLRARSSYLNADQKVKFAEILKEVPVKSGDDGDGLEKISVKKLKALAAEKEIDIKGLKKADEIVEAIRQAFSK